MIEHRFRSPTGPVHAYDCVPCVIEYEARVLRYKQTNPHRPGTKAWAKRENEDGGAAWAVDPRSETYWSS